ncbi:MAG TPA: hypothetical protein PKN04_16065 [bacterium]|nr:hypothetical protein [bacterium]HNT67301.1 hypothetical protein [bacterium]
MGQQQLLLLVLGAIIVGLAIVVGINLFGQGALKANEDAVRQDILTMMARVEEYYRKPIMMGGAGKGTMAEISWEDLGYKYNSDGTTITDSLRNDNGSYGLTGAAAEVTIGGRLKEDGTQVLEYKLSVNAQNVTKIEIVDPEG